jgi:hypothetical protein
MSNEPAQVKIFLVSYWTCGLSALVVYCALSCGEVGTIYPLVTKRQQFNGLHPWGAPA